MYDVKRQKFISIVAMIDNNKGDIDGFISKVYEPCREIFESCELIFVDDASTDGSASYIRDSVHFGPDGVQRLIRMGVKQGLENAMNAGRDLSTGDYVFEFDDLTVDYDIDTVIKAFECCMEGNDIVTVSPDRTPRVSSKLFYSIYNSASTSQNPIGPEAFRVLSRRAVNRVRQMGSHIPYRKAVYMNCGLAVKKLTYRSTDPKAHSHKGERFSLAFDSFIYFTDVMQRFSSFVTLLFLALTIGVIIYVIWSYVADERLVSGWVSLMGFISIGFMGIFGLLSVMLKYLSVIVDLVFKKQRYMIEDVENL